MRTNIDIDDELLAEAMRITGQTTKKGTVEEALRRLVQIHKQSALRKLRGKIEWQGNLDELREGRFVDWGVGDKQ
jgi:Arc/MetJ family transcription regulator